jgi:phage terminase large subunit-like protein
MSVDVGAIARLSPERRREIREAALAERKAAIEQNPLLGFHACEEFCGSPDCPRPSERNPKGGRPKQHEFMAADARIVAAFAGNRMGKTTANVVWALVQHTPEVLLPERLRAFRRAKSKKVAGRYLCPSFGALETVVIPELRNWVPESILLAGSWAKAYSKQHHILRFADGGRLEFFTYDQDAAVMVGASLDYVIYDEPPPEAHYRENLMRTTDRAGCHRFGMTPVNLKGEGIAWVSDQIFDRADEPDVTVVQATIHDNPLLSEDEKAFVLAQYPEDERLARETGAFIQFGGMVYPGGFERVLRPEPSPEEVQRMDVLVGIDPGLKFAAFVWVGFDGENRALAFDGVLLEGKTPGDYVTAICATNKKWGLVGRREPQYVIDPSARNRSLVNAESVESLLMGHGIYCSHGQNDRQAGCQQINDRIREKGFFVVEGLTRLRWEARRYLMKEGQEFDVVKKDDHELDAVRYAVMERLWFSTVEDRQERKLGYQQDFAEPFDPHAGVFEEVGPMGPYS